MDDIKKDDWAIVLTACGPFLGIVEYPEVLESPVTEGKIRLQSAFELKLLQVQTPQGPAMQRRLMPVLFFSSELAVDLVYVGIIWVRDMNEADQGEIAKLVNLVRADLVTMRAAQSGISLATSMPGKH